MRIQVTAPSSAKLLIRVFKILSILLCLVSCSSNRAPVQDISVRGGNNSSYHTVSKGETLYAIAWRYGLDYKELARKNGINSSYTIYPGQRISLSGTAPRAVANSRTAARAPISSKRSSPSSTARSKSTTTPTAPPRSVSSPASQVSWQWPAAGRVIEGYTSQKSLHMGVDIEGRLGESVVAAADGVVVYAGSGIRGYGNLLIIKHNDVYLSAYAHNSKLLVEEKATVRRAQKIAEIGSSGTDRSKLHFEIRREGKPVDPLQYLPRR